ncbi:sigma-54-dependent Fis family transcriptional re gulator [Desulfonema ishimotonii]|uniref:Sigma-54-dependent Fis family transcriptional re gulator n=1 Tax=Desulfonema ishimotonii TaxID=45657 RepID=A0A401G3Y9_9BACT|nr:sigma-54 dependent transcriptional regulator [Desulfonema ishimotonii]GBC63913.1 sigma-54-dependent Fis family transcriptional re gulator [Desulfonema ishimotonii]
MDDKIIIIDDDMDYLDVLWSRLSSGGFKNVHIEDLPLRAAEQFRSGERFTLALIDMSMPDMDGMELLEIIRSNSPGTECIMITAVNDAKIAVECIKKGAYDYLLKPVPQGELLLSVHRALERRNLLDLLEIDKRKTLPELTCKTAFEPIVTRSRNMLKVLKEAELHARSDVPILITGESGTGKELLARAVHAASLRARKPLTPVNMAALTGSLFDSEFFGHTRGAFTGADRERTGYLENTHGGTLFLDEIGIMPLELQGKLLRVLQDGEFIKVGASTPRTADVRIISATNEDMEQLVAQRKFRCDLYYRLRGGWLHLPPLRERKADIPLLISEFLREFCNDNRCRIDVKAMALLMGYNYPGNIRELKSVIQSAVNLAQGQPVTVNCLPEHVRVRKKGVPDVADDATDAILPLAQVEKNHILKIYKQLKGNKSRTARELGIGLNTLRRKLVAYGVK